MIVGITGLHQDSEKSRQTIGAGKDAVADVLIRKHGFVRIGIADHIKRICMGTFAFTVEQLWGPSESRNKPDKRYPRGGRNGKANMEQYLAFKAELDKLIATGVNPESYQVRDLERKVAEWECMAWLTPRYALQQLGTQWGRDCYDPVWMEDALRTASNLLADSSLAYTATEGLIPRVQQYPQGEFEAVENWPKPLRGVVFSDVRFFNEYKAIKDSGGKIVRVRRFSWQPFKKGVDSTHQSETELTTLDDDKFDHIIDNGGDLHHLELLVDRMYDILSGKIRTYDDAQKDVPPGLRTT